MKEEIILWDEDIVWTEQMKKCLSQENIRCREVDSLKEYEKLAGKTEYGAGVVGSYTFREKVCRRDDGMESKSGGSFLEQQLRRLCAVSSFPVMFLAEEESDGEELLAFQCGVREYFPKNRDLRICVARLKNILSAGNFVINNREQIVLEENNHRIQIGQRDISLTEKEYGVFSILYAFCGKVVSREILLQEVWHMADRKNKRVADTVVKQLRHKLTATPYEICSVYGLGYKLHRRKIIGDSFRRYEGKEEHL